MSVGLLLITHNYIGDELLGAAIATLNSCPLNTRIMRIGDTHNIEELLSKGRALIAELNSGAGVLILTDMYGSTPSNVATQLVDNNCVIAVAGLSLPMLIRVFNYAKLSLPELADKAVSGGCEGIVLSTQHQRGYVEC